MAQTARLIEEANFRSAFAGARIVVADTGEGEGSALLAIDGDDLVVGRDPRGAARLLAGHDPARWRPARPAIFWAARTC